MREKRSSVPPKMISPSRNSTEAASCAYQLIPRTYFAIRETLQCNVPERCYDCGVWDAECRVSYSAIHIPHSALVMCHNGLGVQFALSYGIILWYAAEV